MLDGVLAVLASDGAGCKLRRPQGGKGENGGEGRELHLGDVVEGWVGMCEMKVCCLFERPR